MSADFYNVYRGQDGHIDYETPVATMALDDTQVVVPGQTLPAGTIWHYVRRLVRDCCGLESDPSPVCVVRIGEDGEALPAAPNPVCDLTAEAMAGGTVRLRWRYVRDRQAAAPTGFEVYQAAAPDFSGEPEAVVSAATGRGGGYAWTSGVLAEGMQHFCVRAVSADGGRSEPSATASAMVDATGPAAIVNLTAEAED